MRRMWWSVHGREPLIVSVCRLEVGDGRDGRIGRLLSSVS